MSSMSLLSEPDAPPPLQDVFRASTLRGYVGSTWNRRPYIWYVATGELRARQMNSVLGNLWHLLNPILQIGVFFLIFGVVLKTDRGVDNFMLFLTVGVIIFQFSQKATTEGAKSIVSNGGLMRSISFPRAVLPFTATCIETLAIIPAVLVLLSVAVLTGQAPDLRWFALIPILALQTAFNAGAAMVAARATSHVRDVEQILPFLFRLLFYASAIIFSADAYIEAGYRWLFVANPLYSITTSARWAMGIGEIDRWIVLSVVAWGIGLLAGGFIWFRAAEATYGRQ